MRDSRLCAAAAALAILALVASEGKTWTPGAQEDVIDLAASAAEADRLYATTPGGFAAVDANRLLAATEDGTVHESRNGGGDFTVVFRPAAS